MAVILVAALVLVGACGGDDDDGATPTGTAPTGGPGDSATPNDGAFVPPLEGPRRSGTVTERTDFREDPEWQLPRPEQLPGPDDEGDPLYNMPDDPECPEGWTEVNRPIEGFAICYPEDWRELGHGYVSSANEERWYSIGFYAFPGESNEHQLAHVSVYVVPQFTRPLRYTLDCPQPFSTTLAGEPAVICPDFPAVSPEARIVSYHVFRENLDYFVQIATYFTYDEGSGRYTDRVSEEAEQIALDVVRSFRFTPVIPLTQ